MTAAPIHADRVVDLRDDPASDPFVVVVQLPARNDVEWFLYAIPVDPHILDDPARTPMQVALDVGRALKDDAETLIHPAIVERRQGAA